MESVEPPAIPYIPYDFLHLDTMDDAMQQEFRQYSGLPQQGSCPPRPVLGFHHVNIDPHAPISARNHYCAFYFNISRYELHLMGYDYTTNQPAFTTLSDEETKCFVPVCKRICDLHGWEWNQEMTPNTITVHQRNWRGNGHDCGPTVCQTIEHIWLNGFHRRGLYWNGPSTSVCGHQMRYRMAADLDNKLQANINAFDILPTILTNHQLNSVFYQDWDACVYMKNDLVAYYAETPSHNAEDLHRRAEDVHRELRKSMNKCSQCKRRPKVHAETSGAPSQPPRPQPPRPQPPRHGQMSGVRLQSPRQQNPPPRQSRQSHPPSPTSSQSEIDNDRPNPTIANKGIHVRDFSQAQLSRFPRPTPPQQLPPLLPGVQRWLRNPNPRIPFDDYDDRPTKEDMEPIPHRILNWAGFDNVYIAGQLVKDPWVTHRDYGYRLEHNFAEAFSFPPPQMIMEHLMPIGLKNEPQNLDDLLVMFSRDTRFSQDGVEMGAQDVINFANETRSDDIFATGRTDDGSYVRINLE